MSVNCNDLMIDLKSATSNQAIYDKYKQVNHIKYSLFHIYNGESVDLIRIIVDNDNYDNPLRLIRFIMNKSSFDDMCTQIITSMKSIPYLAQKKKVDILLYLGYKILEIIPNFEYHYIEKLQSQLQLLNPEDIEYINYVQFLIDEATDCEKNILKRYL